jgi:uncharacterized protein (DUF1810 family)
VHDQYRLDRFIDAQEKVFEQVVSELGVGRKTGHWMWYIFPQIFGLGSSSMSREFEISSLAEAKAYLQHPILGSRLILCAQLVVDADRRSIAEIFHYPDDLKFRSSMTLFMRASSKDAVFKDALGKYFGGTVDPRTLEALGG